MKSVFRIAGPLALAGAGLLVPATLWAAPVTPAAPASDGGEAQRLVALLDYVAGDYGGAVQDGVVVAPAEYEEQLRFVADARAMALSLLGPGAGEDDPVLSRVGQVEKQVQAKAAADDVRAACRIARDEAVARFHLRTTPTERPSLVRAQALYAQGCAICHGATGDSDTERARELDPPPARFRSPERLRDLSPYRIYNSLTFGVPGTAMASFDGLSPAERWDLAFYVLRLGHAGEATRGSVAFPLGDMAIHSDRELLAALAEESQPEPEKALAHLRIEAPFVEPPAHATLDLTRRLLRRAGTALGSGDSRGADGLVLDAYLEGFEPLEPHLNARDPGETLAVESAFRDLRGAIKQGDTARFRQIASDLDARLERLGDPQQATFPFAAGFLIYFREGIEAALLIGALLAGVRRLGRPDAARVVHLGWISAVPAGVVTWWLLDHAVTLGADSRELVEALVALVAAAVLFSVSFWMISKAESRHWMAYLKRNLEVSLSRRSLAVLGGLSFLALYREAAETVLFTQALLIEATGRHAEVWAGAAAGVVLVAGVALLMSRTVVHLPLAPFFAVSGVLMCGLAISFAGSGIYTLVAAGYLSPRPVHFPEVPWMGIYPDLTGLLVQLTILSVVGVAALMTWRRPSAERVTRRR
jgi:high-affinity iron transporter